MEKFKKLGLSENITQILEKKGFEEPTKIQEKTIPLILAGKDVIGQSATGSGKTLAFASGLIQNIEPGKGVQGIVLTPTRELAEQVADAIREFSNKKLRFVKVYGGVSINPQIEGINVSDVVIATPGRLLDHLQRGTINLSSVKLVVLDEADRMVDMGFVDDVNKIISQCPKNRQTMLFTATISPDIEKIQNRYMNNPEIIYATKQVDPSKLKQVYYDVQDFKKISLLVHLLKGEGHEATLVFCNTRRQADFLGKNLKVNKLDVVTIHGGFTQAKRQLAMERFKSGKANILVCTDVAARGLDIPGVSHVYNYDIPNDPKEYVHRIGRTARAGESGMVVNLISDRDHANFNNVFRQYSNINVEPIDTPDFSRVQIVKIEQDRGPRRGSRQSRSNGPRRGGNRPPNRGSRSPNSRGQNLNRNRNRNRSR